MGERDDPADLARRFLDLWQDQASALARDPETARALERWFALWAAPGARPAGAGAPPGGDDRRGDDSGGAGGAAGPTGAAPAAAAPGDRAPGLDELARRVRDLEERLAALESERDGG